MRILVIGGTGFIGPHVVTCLSEMDHEVIIFHRGEHETDMPSQVKHVHSDAARIPLVTIPDELRDLTPDVVLHMVPVGEQDSRVVMSAFRGVAKRVVSISSQDVYLVYGRLHRTEPGPLEPQPITEDAPLRRKLYPNRGETLRTEEDPSQYLDDYDKILAEQTVMDYQDLPGTVLRLPMVYGPGDPAHRLFKYLKRMDDGRPAILLDEGMAKWRGPRGYVENVAFAIALSVVDERAGGRIYNIAETEALTEEEWVKRIARAAGWEGKVVVVPSGRMEVPYNIDQHWIVDSTRIRRELGYAELVPQEEALMRTISWERRNPPKELDPAQFDYPTEDALLAEHVPSVN